MSRLDHDPSSANARPSAPTPARGSAPPQSVYNPRKKTPYEDFFQLVADNNGTSIEEVKGSNLMEGSVASVSCTLLGPKPALEYSPGSKVAGQGSRSIMAESLAGVFPEGRPVASVAARNASAATVGEENGKQRSIQEHGSSGKPDTAQTAETMPLESRVAQAAHKPILHKGALHVSPNRNHWEQVSHQMVAGQRSSAAEGTSCGPSGPTSNSKPMPAVAQPGQVLFAPQAVPWGLHKVARHKHTSPPPEARRAGSQSPAKVPEGNLTQVPRASGMLSAAADIPAKLELPAHLVGVPLSHINAATWASLDPAMQQELLRQLPHQHSHPDSPHYPRTTGVGAAEQRSPGNAMPCFVLNYQGDAYAQSRYKALSRPRMKKNSYVQELILLWPQWQGLLAKTTMNMMMPSPSPWNVRVLPSTFQRQYLLGHSLYKHCRLPHSWMQVCLTRYPWQCGESWRGLMVRVSSLNTTCEGSWFWLPGFVLHRFRGGRLGGGLGLGLASGEQTSGRANLRRRGGWGNFRRRFS